MAPHTEQDVFRGGRPLDNVSVVTVSKFNFVENMKFDFGNIEFITI